MKSHLPDIRTIDISPVLSDDTNIITSYGDGYFKIKDKKYNANIILSPRNLIEYNKIDDLKNLLKPESGSIIIYSAQKEEFIENIRKFLEEFFPEIASESMNLHSAYRTYNILVQEDRKIYGIFHMDY